MPCGSDMSKDKAIAGDGTSWFASLLGRSSREVAALQEANASLLQEVASLKQQVKDLLLCGAPSELDRTLYSIPPPLPFNPWEWLSTFANEEHSNVLEIGSREVVGRSAFKSHLPKANYTGFDFHAGPNVDVVGDAHRLGDHFESNYFDAIYSTAVFEHLAMPWIVVEEMAKVLRVGGVALVSTHFSYSEHEMPWHFFQFNSTGLEALFNKRLGFEIIAAGKEMPMVGRFSYDCDEHHAGKAIPNLYCSSYVIARKVQDFFVGGAKQSFPWREALGDIYGNSRYPADSSVVKPGDGNGSVHTMAPAQPARP